MKQELRTGIGFQVVFFILFFTTYLAKMNPILGAILSLAIGVSTLFIGIKAFRQREKPVLSFVVMTIAIVILGFTIFAFFIGEGGYPPLIMQ